MTSAVYELPVGKGRHFLGKHAQEDGIAVLGGWQINGIMTFAKGLPIQISNGGNTTGLNSPGIYATDNGQNPALNGAIANRLNEYFVQSVFSQTPNYAFGNVPRFLPNVRAPGIHNLDFSALQELQCRSKE